MKRPTNGLSSVFGHDNSGNILDLAPDKICKKKNPIKKDDYYADFVADVDNFIGVKTINNYVISSIRDDPL